ncbi:MAG: helix-turn-helix transcriptional regulator [Albidovulum sp.]
MRRQVLPTRRKEIAIVSLMLVQGFCATFFMGDLIFDLATDTTATLLRPHFALEFLANLGLVAGIVFEAGYLLQMLRKQAHAERALSVASGALHEVMEGYFETWKLTPSEADVAAFTIKGFAIAEIAELRGSAEATIKTHLNAIYRKAGIAGRGQLVTLLIEELLDGRIDAVKR